MMRNEFLCGSATRDENGKLLFAGMSAEELAARYGTPLYLMDEDRIRENCRTFHRAMRGAWSGKYRILYASKACSFQEMYRIMREEDMGADVVSAGEILTARKTGFPMDRVIFHSNNKTDDDIRFALENGVGHLVADHEDELLALERIAAGVGKCQPILIRLTPGVDAHTHSAVSTGKTDSKFGNAIETGGAERIVKLALSLQHVKLRGFHCHIGSQVSDPDAYRKTVEIMTGFMAEINERLGFVCEVLDLGGGYAVRYTDRDPITDVPGLIRVEVSMVRERVKALGLEEPELWLEPGRSVAADAGITLYTIGTVKRIPGHVNYVSVDGGMTDNIRHCLYGASYTILPASESDGERMVCTVAGRCCENGDILQEDVDLPGSVRRGDILACLTTGAYHYSMASNYNRLPRPPVVMIRNGESRVAVRRETIDDVISLDV